MIQIEGLTKKFGSNLVLHDISIRFNDGGVTGIVGENGAGKTTLFKCMAGLEKFEGKITSGSVRLKDRLGFLPTDPFFFTKMTGREYIRLLCQARGGGTGDVDEKNVFGLPLDQYASTYSTGMKKKLALTAILMQDNDYFIFDEPFNGVDIQSNIIITGIIHKLKEVRKTVILSSHIFSTLADTCDEIHMLRGGGFTKKATKEDFGSLEMEMKELALTNKIDKLFNSK
jgi:ABC-2 type transport system ATP-binding protein